MSKLVKVLDGRHAIAFGVASTAALLLAGCSSDVSSFTNPFQESARFGGSDAVATGTIRPPAPIGQARSSEPRYAQAVPVAPVSRAPVSSVSTAPLAPVGSMPEKPRPEKSWPVKSWSDASAGAPVRSLPQAAPNPARRHGEVIATAHGSWSSDGGATVMVHPGENAAILAERYNVPVTAVIRANGFVSAAQIHPGMRIVIPVYSASSASSAQAHGGRAVTLAKRLDRPEHDSSRREAERRGRTTYHFIKGESSAFDRRGEEKDARAKAAARQKLASERDRAETRHASLDHRITDHGKPERDARLAKSQHAADTRETRTAQEIKHTNQRTAMAETHESAPPVKKMDKTATGSLPPAGVETAAAARPDFRWPARGRIIRGFRAGVNDGINIAVPEGTNVKAVDDGVVAYAGDELKGYGNLVLIRHSNGFVSAYADNGQIDVHRGQVVKRGQIIAKSGQSGNVDSPQLHFELRKGSKPVDPTHYLAGL